MISINRIWEEHIKKLRSEKENKDCWRVSGMGLCARRRYWERLKEEPSDADDITLMKQAYVGTRRHDDYLKLMKDAGRVVRAEEEISLGSFTGHYDAILIDDNGKYIMVDYKTVHSMKLNKVKKEGPDKHRAKQLLAYAYILKMTDREMFDKLIDFVLVYEARDDLRLELASIMYTQDREDSIEKEMAYMDMIWEKKIVPPALKEEDDMWQCKKCIYRTKCGLLKEEN